MNDISADPRSKKFNSNVLSFLTVVPFPSIQKYNFCPYFFSVSVSNSCKDVESIIFYGNLGPDFYFKDIFTM